MLKTVKCPTCSRDVKWSEHSKFRPFCSERCKMIDLGAWASESYSVAGSETSAEADESTGASKSNH
ncbi:MAG: DNA gyrase inhibitor YacG [Burkholderiaceae bacterium]